MRSPARLGLGLALCAAAIAWAGPSRAAPGPRVGVIPFAGAGEGPLRAVVLKALQANGLVAVGGKQIEGTAAKLGVKLDEDAGFAAVARELGVTAFVTGEAGKKRATVTIRDGADGSVAAETLFSGADPKKLKAALAGGFWRRLGSAIGRCRPPAGAKAKAEVAEESAPADEEAHEEAGAAETSRKETGVAAPAVADREAEQTAKPAAPGPDPEGDTENSPDEEAPPPKRRRRPAAPSPAPAAPPGQATPPIALEVGVGGKAVFRRLTWHQDVQMKLAPYTLSPGAEVGSWVELYPAALVTDGPAGDLGIFGSFDYGLGVKSKTPDGSLLTTKFQDFLVGLKFRLPLGVFNPFVSAAYGQQSFRLESASGSAPIPAVAYKLGRFGAGARLVLARALFLDFEGAYLRVTDLGTQPGEIGSTASFPRGTAYGIDADASVGIRIGSVLALRAGVDFRQFGLDFHVLPTDPLIVGGAVDRTIAVWAGLEVALDGAPPAATEPEPEPPAARRPKRRVKAAEPSDEDQ